MPHIPIGRFPIIICVTIILHLVWAFGLAIDPAASDATATHALLFASGDPILASRILFVTAVLAFAGLMAGHRWWWLMLPQQFVLIFAATGCLDAMYLSEFADGVTRPRAFLVVDQIPVVLITLGHTTALLLVSRRQ